MRYFHVDVFCKGAFTGNGLTVMILEEFLTREKMQIIAKEFKQFETIFLVRLGEKDFQARIFTVEEELDFAGHPILGAAAVIHQAYFMEDKKIEISFRLNKKVVQVESKKEEGGFKCFMNQGKVEFMKRIDENCYMELIEPLNLGQENLSKEFPLEVVSTGLPYLLVPVVSGLEKAKIKTEDYEQVLANIGAKFVYIFDVNEIEGRTWDSRGLVEDVATGSAAGPVGAYLYKNKVFLESEVILLRQGRFLERDSEIVINKKKQTDEMIVSGQVCIVAEGKVKI